MKKLLLILILIFCSGCVESAVDTLGFGELQTGWGIKGYTHSDENCYLKIGEISTEFNLDRIDHTGAVDQKELRGLSFGLYFKRDF